MENPARLHSTVTLFVFIATLDFAAGQTAKPRLANYDQRTVVTNQAGKTAVATPASRQSALDLLRERLPGVVVDTDPITGSPKFISAGASFLSGPNGIGGAITAAAIAAIPADDPHRAVKAFLN